MVAGRGELIDVAGHHIGPLAHQGDGFPQLFKADAAGLGGACAREHAGVQHVQVQGEVHRLVPQLVQGVFQAHQVKLVGGNVALPPAELLSVPGADAKLKDFPVPAQLPAPAQHAGVRELHPQVVVPQIRMGVKVEDADVRVLGKGRPKSSQGHQVLAPQQEGPLPRL